MDKKFEYRQNKIENYPTYYANKYNISVVDKNHLELMTAIYKYEMKNLNKLIKELDPITREYGYYIINDI